jgi:hypothetical protein
VSHQRTLFYRACPGVILDRPMDDALHALGPNPSASQIQAACLPYVPDGNAPPGGLPQLPPALPPQPDVTVPSSGGSTVLVFARGVLRFADSNPDPVDRWSIDADQTGWLHG